MDGLIHTVTVTLESVDVLDDRGLAGAALYFIGTIGGHVTGRSRVHRPGSATSHVALTTPDWTWEFYVADGAAPIELELAAWDEDLAWEGQLGRVSAAVGAPWAAVSAARTTSSDGRFALNWRVAVTSTNLRKPAAALVFRQPVGGTQFSTLAPPDAVAVRITQIDGLYKPGVDDRPDPKPAGTTRNAGKVPGYTSEDDLGRVYLNRLPDGTWAMGQQFIELTARVFPDSAVLSAGDAIVWSFEDPDDPSNDDPHVHREAGAVLDPGDYAGDAKTAAAPDDNNAYGTGVATPRFEQISARFALSGTETLVDPVSRTSRVRFHASDVAGDNFRITARFKPTATVTRAVAFKTGVFTLWNRIDLEYVKMPSAAEIPVEALAAHWELARAQVDISSRHETTPAGDRPDMGSLDTETAYRAALKLLGKQQSGTPGECLHAGEPGWFFVLAANKLRPLEKARVLYDGTARAHGRKVTLDGPLATGDAPYMVRVYNPALLPGLTRPKPDGREFYTVFFVAQTSGRTIRVDPHEYKNIEAEGQTLHEADLTAFGFGDGAPIEVQVVSLGFDVDYGGVSERVTVGGKDFATGQLVVFTRNSKDFGVTLSHELCHAFDNHHMCGNWDVRNRPFATRTSCAMNYFFMNVFDRAPPPPAPLPADTPWTYTVQSGDYPVKIAEKLTGDARRYPELVDANCPPKQRAANSFASLVPGEKLRLPNTWLAHVDVTPRPAHVEGPGTVPSAGPRYEYTVESGDYPVKIAEKLTGDARRYPELVDANCPPKQRAGNSFASVVAGEKLQIPDAWNAAIESRMPLANVTPINRRPPIPWTNNRQSPHLCAEHVRRMRRFHFADNLALHWK